MTFQQLQYLLEVSRTGSISQAAKNLFLAQSSVSTAISTLEEELGFPLFLRSKNGVLPTAQGAEVLEEATRILESHRRMKQAGLQTKRRVRLSAPVMEPLDEVFAQLIAHFAEDDNISFSSDSFSTAEAVEKVSSFELDAALLLNHEARFLSTETMLKSHQLSWQTMAKIPAVIQLGPQHPLYEKEDVGIGDLEGCLFADDVGDPLVHNEFLKGILRLSPEKTVSVRSSFAKELLLSEGLCFSIGTGAPKETAEKLQLRSIPLKGVFYLLTAVTNPRRTPTKEIQTYLSMVSQKFSHC